MWKMWSVSSIYPKRASLKEKNWPVNCNLRLISYFCFCKVGVFRQCLKMWIENSYVIQGCFTNSNNLDLALDLGFCFFFLCLSLLTSVFSTDWQTEDAFNIWWLQPYRYSYPTRAVSHCLWGRSRSFFCTSCDRLAIRELLEL